MINHKRYAVLYTCLAYRTRLFIHDFKRNYQKHTWLTILFSGYIFCLVFSIFEIGFSPVVSTTDVPMMNQILLFAVCLSTLWTTACVSFGSTEWIAKKIKKIGNKIKKLI